MTSSYVEKMKARKRRTFMAVALLGTLTFLSIVAYALFGDSGILVNMRIKDEYRQLANERDALVIENEKLKAEIRAVKNNKRKIEEISRDTFGFGRPGEIIFYFPADEKQPIEQFHNKVETGPEQDL